MFFFFSDPNWVEQTTISPAPRTGTLGRQKRVIEPSVTPSTTPILVSGEDVKPRPMLKTFDKIVEIGSPESPLSKMSIMPNPLPNTSQAPENLDLLSPKSVTQLEFPTPERLLPIGQHKDGINTLADKVREVLSISEISHLKQESSFEKSEVTYTIKCTFFDVNLFVRFCLDVNFKRVPEMILHTAVKRIHRVV